MGNLSSKKVAVLSANGFEESELFEPVEALKNEGASIEVISLEPGEIKGMKHEQEWGKSIAVDKLVNEANIQDYDALLIPGGVINPDALRADKNAVNFIKDFFNSGKPVASICHGPQTLISAGVANGVKLTSVKHINVDLKNAGANWVDEQVVHYKNLITSRTPDDLPAFNSKIVEVFGQ